MITPQNQATNLAKKIGLNAPLYLKREDLHQLGSHKGRSIPIMIEKYAAADVKNFVISSSGNAALAAALYVKQYNQKNADKIGLKIFVGKNIDANKLEHLLSFRAKRSEVEKSLAKDPSTSFHFGRDDSGTDDNGTDDNMKIEIIQTKNPKQSAFQVEKSGQAKNLRQSTDDTALTGYEELAKEIVAQCHSRESGNPHLSAVFIPTSSGTTAQGLHDGFKKLGINPQIHIVQTTACHPMVNPVILNEVKDPLKSEHSLASAIVDKVAHRKNNILEILKSTHGQGWIATDEDILNAQKLVQETEGIEISPNSALSVAGLIHSLRTGADFPGPIVCLITGK